MPLNMLRVLFVLLTSLTVWSHVGNTLAVNPDPGSFVLALGIMVAWYAVWMRLACLLHRRGAARG